MSKTKILLATALSTAIVGGVSAQSARDYISIVGSSTVYPFATVVVEQFGKTTQFKTPKVESTGSGGGLKMFCAGVGVETPDITNSSRRIKQSEFEMCQKNGVKDIIEVKIGYDGIAIANSKQAAPMELSLRDIFLALAKDVPDPNGGEKLVANPYKTWKDVNPALPDQTIEVLGPTGWTQLTMSGVVASPEYIWPSRSRQDIITSPDNFGVVFAEQALAAAFTAATLIASLLGLAVPERAHAAGVCVNGWKEQATPDYRRHRPAPGAARRPGPAATGGLPGGPGRGAACGCTAGRRYCSAGRVPQRETAHGTARRGPRGTCLRLLLSALQGPLHGGAAPVDPAQHGEQPAARRLGHVVL